MAVQCPECETVNTEEAVYCANCTRRLTAAHSNGRGPGRPNPPHADTLYLMVVLHCAAWAAGIGGALITLRWLLVSWIEALLIAGAAALLVLALLSVEHGLGLLRDIARRQR